MHWGIVLLLLLLPVIAGYFVNKKFPLVRIDSATYFRSLGEPAFALIVGSAITFLIYENASLTVGEGIIVLMAVTAIAFGLLALFTRGRM